MFSVTSLVPLAAWPTLRTISWVAEPCSSTAAAIEVVTWLISPIRPLMVRIAPTACSVEAWMRPICSSISWVARVVWLASSLTSAATTAKPRPASPARAASMVALSASRLVWPAMVVISADDVADPRGGGAEVLDEAGGLGRLLHRAQGEVGRAVDLAADLLHRRAEFLGRRRHGVDVGGRLLGGRRHRHRLVGGAGRVGAHRLRRSPAARRPRPTRSR